MKSVLISIKPKWCELIASGKKTIEVRKAKPKLETPFKVYIYCTQGKSKADISYIVDNYGIRYQGNGKIIGEFVCDDIKGIQLDTSYRNEGYGTMLDVWVFDGSNMPVIDEENNVSGFDSDEAITKYAEKRALLYGWHISDLVIYDKPKELSEFMRKPCDFAASCGACVHSRWSEDNYPKFVGCSHELKRPPQSWCYVEDIT